MAAIVLTLAESSRPRDAWRCARIPRAMGHLYRIDHSSAANPISIRSIDIWLSVLLYKFVETLEPWHYNLQRSLTLIVRGCSGIIGCDCPVRVTARVIPVDDGNPRCSFAILGRLQFVEHEALDLDAAFRESLHHTSASFRAREIINGPWTSPAKDAARIGSSFQILHCSSAFLRAIRHVDCFPDGYGFVLLGRHDPSDVTPQPFFVVGEQCKGLFQITIFPGLFGRRRAVEELFVFGCFCAVLLSREHVTQPFFGESTIGFSQPSVPLKNRFIACGDDEAV